MKLIEVNFHQDVLEVVENGSHWIGIKAICKNLGIDFKYQHQKLKSDPTYEAKLIKAPTPGGIQEVFCIPLEKLNGWLFTINPNKVKPEVREKLIAYKNECFRVLYDHFVAKARKDPERIGRGYKAHITKLKKRIEELERRSNEGAPEAVMKLIEKGLKYDELMARCIELEKIVTMLKVNEEYVKHTVSLMANTYRRIHEMENSGEEAALLRT